MKILQKEHPLQVKKALKHLNSVGFLCATISLGAALAPTTTQAQSIIFSDDFGTPSGRVVNPYSPTGANAFVFANPAMEYALPRPAGSWSNSDSEWVRTSKDLQNNHYAVVTPSNIFNSVSPGYTPFYNSWTELIASGQDAAGNPNGGVYAVNAGTTPGILYQRNVTLERGKYYKISYDLWVQNAPVQLKINLLGATNKIGLGTSMGASNGGGAQRRWLPQTHYIYLPTAVCDDDKYIFNLQNHLLENVGNDFAIDNLQLEEIASLPGGASALTISCASEAAVPIPNDDTKHVAASTQTTKVPLLANDLKSDGTAQWTNTGTWGDASRLDEANRFKIEFVVPAGESSTTNDMYFESGIVEDGTAKLKINGEGTWTIKYDYNEPGQFYAEFVPEAGFVGNPSPIQYVIKEYATAADRANDNGITSTPATITLTFALPSNPVATDDYEKIAPGTLVYTTEIFDNDTVDGTAATTLKSPENYLIQVAHPLNESAVYKQDASGNLPPIVVAGEGTWEYDKITGSFSFTPETGFTTNPTPLSYRFQEPTNDVWSNWVKVYFDPENSLPVTLVQFTATTEKGIAQLTWSTSEESNAQQFEVERSSNGRNWTQIGIVAAIGGANGHQNYHTTDASPISGINYYRLKMVDLDGTFAYSTIKSVKISAGQKVSTYVYPNPASDKLVIASGTSEIASVNIYNSNGKLALSVSKLVNNEVEISSLPAGKYFVKYTYQDASFGTSLLIIKH